MSDWFEKYYIKKSLQSVGGKKKTPKPKPSAEPKKENFEAFLEHLSEIIKQDETLVNKLKEHKKTAPIKKYLEKIDPFSNLKKNHLIEPSTQFPVQNVQDINRGFVNHYALFAEDSRRDELEYHEMHGHDGHGDADDGSSARERPFVPPVAPYYAFLTLASPPIASISASYAGEPNISNNIFYNTSFDAFFYTYDSNYAIAFGLTDPEAFSIFDFFTFDEFYYSPKTNAYDIMPLTGWSSTNPSYDPPPVLSLSSTLESFFCGNINNQPPVVGPNDFFANSDYTVLYATLSSSQVSNINTLLFNYMSIKTADFSKFTALTALTLSRSSVLSSLDLGNCNNLQFLNLDEDTALNSLNVNSNHLAYVSVSNSQLKHQSIDNIYASLYSSPNSYNFFYANSPEGRSAASNTNFIELYKRNVYIYPAEIDPSYPVLQPPDTYVSSSLLGNSFSIMSPVSTFGATTVRSKTLTGTYVKTGDTFNNRDVFQNNQNYFVLYNSALKLWTLVGPGSSSTTVWLSADAGVGDWGNPPNAGWRGIAYNTGGTASNRWYQGTRLQTTQTLAHSGTFNYPYYGDTSNLMSLYDPASGINGNFRWRHLDFTGRVYPNTNPYQSVQGRGTMISPVHFTYAVHFNPWFRPFQPANNDVCKIYDANGNATSVTVLSSLIVGGDIGVAILSQPVSATQYFVLSGNYNYLKPLSAADSFNNYLVGPTQTGTVGVGLPVIQSDAEVNFFTNLGNTPVADYRDIYSVPHSEWHGGGIITGDSSSQMWAVSGNRLLLVGHTYYGGNSVRGPYYGYFLQNPGFGGTTLIRAITTLNQRYYGNAFAYSLTAVSF